LPEWQARRAKARALSPRAALGAGQYAVVLVNREDLYGTILRVGETGIVRVDTLFDISPESLDATLEREAETMILAPVGQ
jgi:hypothetical protein